MKVNHCGGDIIKRKYPIDGEFLFIDSVCNTITTTNNNSLIDF